MRIRLTLVIAAAVLLLAALDPGVAIAEQSSERLVLRFGNQTGTFSAAELLQRPDLSTLTIPFDVSYGRAMQYRAVPLRALLSALPYRRFAVVQVAANDGFVAEIPTQLLSEGGAIPWIAVENPRAPWPKFPKKAYGAGPFYLLWEHPQRSAIMSEQWVSNIGTLTGMESPLRRWPQLDAGAAASAEVRRGMDAFVTQCLPCHRFDGAGSSTVGPDLGRPMNATRYLTDDGFRALVRDPTSVRSWPAMRMPGFSSSILPNETLDAILLYLKYKR
ncbi:MAG TPA: cytochrome c [Candidatus Cybelea sp.]|jgi:mono/diheme cytochrome c family protein|nr:cytochrome c [Candidatus Cybelea sp.]